MSSLVEMREATENVISTLLTIQAAFGNGCGFSVHNAEGWHLSALAKMLDSVEQLLPFKVGDRVMLVKAPKCEGGWYPSRKCLVKGATGIVRSIDFCHLDNKWAAYIELDHETWVKDNGEIGGSVSPKHVFGFTFKNLMKIEDEQDADPGVSA